MRAVGKKVLSKRPLKKSLVTVTVALVVFGLAISSIAVSMVMESYMKDRVDEQLKAAISPNGWAMNTPGAEASVAVKTDDVSRLGLLIDGLLSPDNAGRSAEVGSRVVDAVPTDFFVARVDIHGNVMDDIVSRFLTSRPDLRGMKPESAPVDVPALPGSRSDSGWRAISTAVDETTGEYRIVALPMEGENHTITRLMWMQLIIGIAVALLALVASYHLVRRALKPLNEVEYTASEIAKGNLSHRVPSWPEQTEVGRLSLALNEMLGQIQTAFHKVGQEAERAERSEESMRRFIGDASHELRTPLTSVRGYAELYRSGATDDAAMVLDRIYAESQRMTLLVEDLLALVRMDEGRPLAQEKVDMLELVLNAAESARASFPERTIDVHNKAGCIPVVLGDVNRLHQVLSNLLTNAMRHAGENASVDMTLSVEEGKVQVIVADDGQGIDMEYLPHIFERFYRPDISRSRASGGSGLGLSIVQGLVKAHGGMISVESEVGVGTSFMIELPRFTEGEDAED